MRIISRERDYYDHVQAYGVDPAIVYDRTFSRESTEIPRHVIESLSPVSVYLAKNKGAPRWYWRGTPEIRGYYSLIGGIVRSIWYELPNPDARWEDFDKDTFKVHASKAEALAGRRERFSRLLTSDQNRPPLGSDVFMEFAKEVGSPVIVFQRPGLHGGSTFIDCPILGDMGYGKIIPATQVYSDIYNFMLSIKDRPMVEISDLDKIRKAGFDMRQSFRHRK